MKRLLTTFRIGPFEIAVLETDEPIDGGDDEAEFDPNTLEIVMLSSLRGARRWAILFHELTHAISILFDLDIDAEYVCSTLANGFVQALEPYLSAPPELPEAVEDDHA